MVKLDRSRFDNKNDFLWYILNDLGCSDFQLSYSYRRQNGETAFSKRVSYMQLLHLDFKEIVPGTFDSRQMFIKKACHRTVLDIEILIDVDDKGRFSSTEKKAKFICKKLDSVGLGYVCSTTGSKGFHISLLFPELRGNPQTQEFRSYFLSWIGADVQKSSSKNMIALEGEPHWKSGKIKEAVVL